MRRRLKQALVGGVLAAFGLGVAAQNLYPSVTGATPGGSGALDGAGSVGGLDFSAGMLSMPRIIGAAPAPFNGPGTPVSPGLASLPATEEPLEPNAFQKFVLQATGKLLPIFGSQFFASPGAYAPRQGVPVPADYALGPGDEVVIRGWGSVDVDYRGTIDRNGTINVPKIGTISLAGVRASNAEDVVRAAFGKVFRGVSLNVTLGQLRGMNIYLVGQARRPGAYVVSSLSTAVSAIFESGGPNANGSLRRVQVKRSGKVVAEIDLYALLAHGDKTSDVHLQDGDVVMIPPAYGFVALTGKVETPAIYELSGPDDTVGNILDVAGGLPIVADPRRALLERIDPERKLPRSVDEFALDEAGLKKTMKSGDLLTVLQITPEFSNAISLQGSVFQALRVPYRAGMRVSDLIPNKEFLVSRAAVRRQNAAIILHDRKETEIERKQFPFESEALEKARKRKGAPLDANAQTAAGINEREDAMLSSESRTFVDSIGKKFDEINWDYAVVERINRAELSESLVSFNLGRALADPKGPDNIPLQPGDTVSVFSANDVRVPIAKRKVFVRVEGEVRQPGVYQAEPGESLVNLVQKAGGATPDAYLFGTEFYRESVRKAQQENLNKYIRRLEQQQLSESARLAANVSPSDAQVAGQMQARLAADSEARRQFLQRLRQLKSEGRISLGLPAKDPSVALMPLVRLENGDRLVLPTRPDFVQVVGSVNTEAALIWQPGRSVSDYLAQAGISKDSDRDGTFIIRADGTVISNADRWFTSVAGAEAMPGDVIVVPENIDRETFWTAFTRSAKDVTQILSNFGLGAAAIHTLSK